MANFQDTLFSLRGRVMTSRPQVPADFVNNAINDRIRQIMDRRTFWADMLTPGILSFPAPINVGLVNTTNGSAVISATGASWPVADLVNTTIPSGVSEFGYVEVTPSSMVGITANSYLLVDASVTPEIVPVVEITRSSFIAKFTQLHNPGCTITQSSLAGLQLRMGESYPIFTVAAILSNDGSGNCTAQLTLPWGGPSLTQATYTIQLMYVMLATDIKGLIAMKDEATGYPVRLHVPLTEADHFDPQRSIVTGNPWFSMVDRGANDQGNLTYEVWPAPGDQRQFSYYYWKQWPDMVKDTDRPPPFINPSTLYFGALADAKMYRGSRDDPYYDPQGAQYYEAKFDQAVQDAKNSDEAKVLTALKNPFWKGMFPGNYDTLQLFDASVSAFFAGQSW